MQHDLVVIGAGPAGMTAAVEAASRGLSVVQLDEQRECGGQIYRSIASVAAARPDDLTLLGADYARGLRLADALHGANVDYRPNANVWNIEPATGSVFYSTAGSAYSVSAKRILMATGGIERPFPVPGWTLAGVMGAGGAQILQKSADLVPDGPAVLAGCGPLLLLTAGQLHSAGVEIAAVIETTTWRHYLAGAAGILQALAAPEYLLKGIRMRRALKRARIPMFSGAQSLEAVGNGALEAVRCRAGGTSHTIPATSLLLHDGVIPNTALSRQVGIEHEWCSLQQFWQPRVGPNGGTSRPNILVAGDGAGILGGRAAEHSGHIVALSIARELGAIGRSDYKRQVRRHQLTRWRHGSVRPLLDSLFAPSPANAIVSSGDGIVCRCYDVSRKVVEEAVRAGCQTPDQVKALVRSGMGPCQGRMCAPTISQIIADVRREPIEDVGVYRVRPPIKPITFRELASLKPA